MELISPIAVKSIVGLGTWAADEFYEQYRKNKLNEDRLGEWHSKIFNNKVLAKIVKTNKVNIFKMPSYSTLESVMEEHTEETALGAVCWRALLNKFVKESSALKIFSGPEYFVKKDQVGHFKGNVAALANVSDIYKIIFSNLDPVRWRHVTLNKVERMATIIGDFSMLYLDNAKWFHFTPSYNRIKVGKYRDSLKQLLKHGHTVQGLDEFEIKDQITEKSTIGCWAMHESSGDWSSKFKKAVLKQVKAAANGAKAAANDKRTGVFHGGVTTKSKEYEVSRLLANVIHMALLSILPSASDHFNVEESFREKAGSRDLALEFHIVESAFLTGDTVEEICEMASAASKIAVAHLSKQVKENVKFNRPQRFKSLELVKALKLLRTNLAVLDWDVDDLEMLEQEAWLAGVDDTVLGDTSEDSDGDDA